MPVPTTFVYGWAALVGAALSLFAVVFAAAWWQHRREVPSRRRRLAEQAEWAEHAVAVVDRAQQAAQRVAAAQALLATAEREAAEAWVALELAESAHDEAARRYEEARQRSGAPAADPADQAEVSHAAFAAYRRGDLSQEQLWRVWSWGTGWGPELAERERELMQLRSELREARLSYRAAAGRERAAAAEVEVALVQARALSEEVATAAEGAGWHDDPDEQRSPQPG